MPMTKSTARCWNKLRRWRKAAQCLHLRPQMSAPPNSNSTGCPCFPFIVRLIILLGFDQNLCLPKNFFGRWHRYYCSIVGLGEKARRYAEDLERFNLTQTQVALLSAFFSPSVSSSYWDSIRICAFFKIGLKLCWGPVKAPVYHFSTVVCSLLH